MRTFKINEKHLFILKSLSEGTSIETIAKQLNVTKRALYKQIERLEENGYIRSEKIGRQYKNFYISSKALVLIQNVPNISTYSQNVHNEEPQLKRNKIRNHNVSFILGILEKPKDWENYLKKTLEKREINFEIARMKNWNQYIFHRDVTEIRTTPKSIIIKTPEIYSDSPRFAGNEAFKYMIKAVYFVENLFRIKLRKTNQILAEVITEHNALIHNEFAEFFFERGINEVRFYDEKGELRWKVDNSQNLKELEAVHPKNSEDDVERMKHFIEDVYTGRQEERIEKIVTATEQSFKATNELIPTIRELKKQIELHLTVQQKNLEVQENTLKTQEDISKTQRETVKTMESIRKNLELLPKQDGWKLWRKSLESKTN